MGHSNPTPRKACHDTLHLLVVHNKDTVILGWLSCDWMLAGHFPFIVAERIKEEMNYVGYFYNRKHFSNSSQQRIYIKTVTLKPLNKQLSSAYCGVLRWVQSTDTAAPSLRPQYSTNRVLLTRPATIVYFSDEPQTQRMSICQSPLIQAQVWHTLQSKHRRGISTLSSHKAKNKAYV